jgi:hypothetical protein
MTFSPIENISSVTSGGNNVVDSLDTKSEAENVEVNDVNDLANGQWGKVLTSSDFNLDLPSTIINPEAVINASFEWHSDIMKLENLVCRRSYAQAILDLMKLPTGKNLIQKVIIKCHENASNGENPRKVVFKGPQNGNDGQPLKENLFYWERGKSCSIYLRWHNDTNQHSWDEWVLLARKQNQNELNFVNVRVPPAIVLAHELGHFLWGITIKEDTHVAKSLYIRAQERARKEYDKIFKNFVTDTPTTASKVFIGSWNHGNYLETVNILPLADIPSAGNVVGLRYSDGIFIGEALNSTWDANQKPQFTDFQNNNVTVNYATLPAGNFVRFGHSSSGKFWREFNSLNSTEKKSFNELVTRLLSKIKVESTLTTAGYLKLQHLPEITG